MQTKYWDFKDGPILFYTGNEGTIWSFFNNTGYYTETVAEQFNALVVFGEHRYFGESFPTTFEKKDAFKPENVKYLTVEQAMMDYVELLKHVKYTYAAHDSPVIAFGGSYGGMLTAWMRMKYPHVINGGIAASAPILYFKGVVEPEAFFTQTTQTFAETLKTGQTKPDGHCSKLIRESWDHLMLVKDNLSTQASKLKDLLELCDVPTKASDIEDIYEHFASGL